jgi:Ulp1 family protease
MFVPICRSSHWTLIIADRRTNLISLYDSSRKIPARDLDVAEVCERNGLMAKCSGRTYFSDSVFAEIRGISELC